jgi:membrane protein required for beta-lactamase induction
LWRSLLSPIASVLNVNVVYYISTSLMCTWLHLSWRWRPQRNPKLWYISTRVHGFTSQNTVIFRFAAVRTWNLTSTSTMMCVLGLWLLDGVWIGWLDLLHSYT